MNFNVLQENPQKRRGSEYFEEEDDDEEVEDLEPITNQFQQFYLILSIYTFQLPFLTFTKLSNNNRRMHNKQNQISQKIQQKLQHSQNQLTNYLQYLKQKPTNNHITLDTNILKQSLNLRQQFRQKKPINDKVKIHIENYVKIVKEVINMENNVGKKIIKKFIQYLEEFPTMEFLIESFNSFGKMRKKLCLNENFLNLHSNDDMIPLFQKILGNMEELKKGAESKKLMQLGHRIEHLQKIIEGAKNQSTNQLNNQIFKTFEADRVQKYLIMQENINKAEKNFGKFSVNFHKNKQVFSNINKVYSQINKVTEKN